MSALLIVSLRAACLAAVVGLLDATLLRRAWPQLRATLWTCVLASLVVPPSFGTPLGWDVAVAAGAVDAAAVEPTTTPRLVIAWLVVAAAATLVSAIVVRRREAALRRDARKLPRALAVRVDVVAQRAGLALSPRVVLAPHVGGPCVVGRLRPTVLLPPGLVRSVDAATLDDVLLHECTHVARRDPLAAALTSLVTLVFWFHPAAWFAARRLATLREFCCDADVARRLGDDVPRYRRTLARCALLELAPSGALGLLGAARRPALLTRLAALETPRAIVPTRGRRAASLLAAALALAALPTWTPHAATPPSSADVAQQPGCLHLRYAVLSARAEAAGFTPPVRATDLLTASR